MLTYIYKKILNLRLVQKIENKVYVFRQMKVCMMYVIFIFIVFAHNLLNIEISYFCFVFEEFK